MKTKLSKLTMVMLILALSETAVFAQNGDSNQTTPPTSSGTPSAPAFAWHGRRGGPMGAMMTTMLGLTEDQQSQIRSIHSASREAMRPLWQQQAALRQQIRQATEAATFNQPQIQALAAQIGQIQAQMTVARAQTEWKAFNVLTPDQQSKLMQFQQQMEQRRHNRMNKRTPAS